MPSNDDLKFGCKDREAVLEWQLILSETCGYGIASDGVFGRDTEYCTRLFQKFKKLSPTGVVDAETWDAGVEGIIPLIRPKFVPSKNFTKSFRCRLELIVCHTMEVHDTPTSAEAVADVFAGLRPNQPPPEASFHIGVDRDSAVQCVRDNDIAWHASNVNRWSLGFEHAGWAKTTRSEWLKGTPFEILRLSARVASDKVRKYDIPIQLVSTDDLKRWKPGSGAIGFTGHVNVNKAFNCGDHWDPGPGWPWDVYLELVRNNGYVK